MGIVSIVKVWGLEFIFFVGIVSGLVGVVLVGGSIKVGRLDFGEF